MVTFKKYLLTEAGLKPERQERSFIEIINSSAKDGPIAVNDIKNVTSAHKMEGTNLLGTEPYTDVVLTLSNNRTLNISLKGGTEDGISQAPSVAGGGLAGLKSLIPDVISNFLKKANQWYKKKYKQGDIIPDVYGKLKDNDVELVIAGNEDMGGPIHYVYIGPMNVTGDLNNNKLTLNGKFFTVDEYAKKHSIYFRLRKRRDDQPYEPDLLDNNGNPLILGRSPSKGDTGRRIVVVDRLPTGAAVIEL
jgi:hypothetical protein